MVCIHHNIDISFPFIQHTFYDHYEYEHRYSILINYYLISINR